MLLYGDRAGVEPGWGLAVWATGLLVAGAGAAVLSLLSFVGANTPDATERQLAGWGVLDPDENWVAAVPDGDEGTSGCVLTGQAVVRWDDGQRTARVRLKDVPTVTVEGDRLWLSSEEHTIDCAARVEGGVAFDAMVTRRIDQLRQDWRPGPDPRVAHLYR